MLLRHIRERQKPRQARDEILPLVHRLEQRGKPLRQLRFGRGRREEQPDEVRKDAAHEAVPVLGVFHTAAVQQLALHVAEHRAGKHAVRRERRRVEHAALHVEVVADFEEKRFRNADVDDLKRIAVEQLVAVHVVRADQDERALGQKLRPAVDRMHGAALRHEEQLVKIMRMDLVGGVHAELVERLRAVAAQLRFVVVQPHDLIAHRIPPFGMSPLYGNPRRKSKPPHQ